MHEIADDAPDESDTEYHESGSRGDFLLPQPPQSYEGHSYGEAGVEPEGFGDIAVEQSECHALDTAEGAVKSCEPM